MATEILTLDQPTDARCFKFRIRKTLKCVKFVGIHFVIDHAAQDGISRIKPTTYRSLCRFEV